MSEFTNITLLWCELLAVGVVKTKPKIIIMVIKGVSIRFSEEKHE